MKRLRGEEGRGPTNLEKLLGCGLKRVDEKIGVNEAGRAYVIRPGLGRTRLRSSAA